MGQLTKLGCSASNFDKVPPCLFRMTNLQALDLSYTGRLEGHEALFVGLPNLTHLTKDGACPSNHLDSICKAPALTHLSLVNCRIRSLPEVFVGMHRLEYLNLSKNNLAEVPAPLIARQGKPCLVDMDYNPISHDRDSSGSWHFIKGKPTEPSGQYALEIAHTHRLTEEQSGTRSSADLLEHWYDLAGMQPSPAVREKFGDDEATKILLRKLTRFGNYIDERLYGDFAKRVVALLDEMVNDPEVGRASYAVLHDSTQTCADKAAMILCDMELAARQAIQKHDLESLADFLCGYHPEHEATAGMIGWQPWLDKLKTLPEVREMELRLEDEANAAIEQAGSGQMDEWHYNQCCIDIMNDLGRKKAEYHTLKTIEILKEAAPT